MAANNPEIVTPAIFFLQPMMISWFEYVVDCLIEPDVTRSINLITRLFYFFMFCILRRFNQTSRPMILSVALENVFSLDVFRLRHYSIYLPSVFILFFPDILFKLKRGQRRHILMFCLSSFADLSKHVLIFASGPVRISAVALFRLIIR